MANYDCCVKVPKNKLKACALCLLLCMANLIGVAEARKAAPIQRTKAPPNRGGGYASDQVKLSYSPNYSSVPVKPQSAPAQQPQTPIGWNVPNHASPPYSGSPNHGPPPPYSPPRFNEPPPSYTHNNPGFPGAAPGAFGAGAAGGVVAGNAYRPHGHNVSSGGFGGGFQPGAPNAGYPVQPVQGFPNAPVPQHGGGYPGGYQPGPGGFPPQQPGYAVPPGGYQQPATIVQQSGGTGLGTVLGAGLAGAAAGVGGAALYDALKPKEAKEAEPTTTTTTTTTTLAPINPNGEAPLAPLPPNPNGEAPLAAIPEVHPNPNGEAPLAPLPAETTTEAAVTETATTDNITVTTESPLGSASLAPFPVSESSNTSSETTNAPVSTVAVEAPNSALNVQPNLASAPPESPTTSPQLSAEPATGTAASSLQMSFLMLALSVLFKFLL